jgi:histone acetyltransferase (RNA polymerase elongator complex component)
MKHYNIPIFIPHLGCPYDCIYCNQRTITAQQEIPTPEQVIRTIEQHLRTIPSDAAVEVGFFGGNFTAVDKIQQENYLRVVQPFLRQGRIKSIRVSTRPDCINEDTLDLLAAYGVKMIELGVQSLSDRVLQASARNYSPEDVCKTSYLIQARKFELGIQLMIGLPQDNYGQVIETTRQVIDLRPQAVRIYPALVLAGTTLETMWQSGEYEPMGLEEAVATCRDMFLLFQKENIKVIRMGLYPGPELRRDGAVKAGPFHPSFGELVEQAAFKEQAHMLVKCFRAQIATGSELELYVNFRDISKLTGPKKIILQELCRDFGLLSLRIKTEPGAARNWIGVSRSGASEVELGMSRGVFLGLWQ